MSTGAQLALDGTEHPLDPRVRIVWAAGSALLWLGLGAVGAVVLAITVSGALAGVAVAAAVVLAALSGLWAHLAWRAFRWSAWDDALELRHGVVTRRSSLVPYHRIQQIDVHRGPIERAVGLASLVLRTAASSTDAELPGIAAGDAEQLRHELLARAGIDDAV